MKKLYNIKLYFPELFVVDRIAKFDFGRVVSKAECRAYFKTIAKMESEKRVIKNPSPERIKFFNYLKDEGMLNFNSEA